MINKLKKGFLLKRRLFLQVTLGAGMLGEIGIVHCKYW